MSSAYDYVRKHQEKNIASGICRDCTKPATDGIFCFFHRQKYNAASTKVRQERKNAGLCLRCPNPIGTINDRFCDAHAIETQFKTKRSDVSLPSSMAELLGVKRIDKNKLVRIKTELQKNLSEEFIDNLSDTEKVVLEYRILNEYPISLRIMGKTLDLSHEWIRKTENDLIAKLKIYINKNNINLIK